MAEFSGLLSAYTITRAPGTLSVSVAHNDASHTLFSKGLS